MFIRQFVSLAVLATLAGCGSHTKDTVSNLSENAAKFFPVLACSVPNSTLRVTVEKKVQAPIYKIILANEGLPGSRRFEATLRATQDLLTFSSLPTSPSDQVVAITIDKKKQVVNTGQGFILRGTAATPYAAQNEKLICDKFDYTIDQLLKVVSP